MQPKKRYSTDDDRPSKPSSPLTKNDLSLLGQRFSELAVIAREELGTTDSNQQDAEIKKEDPWRADTWGLVEYCERRTNSSCPQFCQEKKTLPSNGYYQNSYSAVCFNRHPAKRDSHACDPSYIPPPLRLSTPHSFNGRRHHFSAASRINNAATEPQTNSAALFLHNAHRIDPSAVDNAEAAPASQELNFDYIDDMRSLFPKVLDWPPLGPENVASALLTNNISTQITARGALLAGSEAASQPLNSIKASRKGEIISIYAMADDFICYWDHQKKRVERRVPHFASELFYNTKTKEMIRRWTKLVFDKETYVEVRLGGKVVLPSDRDGQADHQTGNCQNPSFKFFSEEFTTNDPKNPPLLDGDPFIRPVKARQHFAKGKCHAHDEQETLIELCRLQLDAKGSNSASSSKARKSTPGVGVEPVACWTADSELLNKP
ncbi:hypothetical protein BT69DRAFT_1297643 [Atractiella rhizophila]|nr:hypothetical protein BT69DRAFT_1297643 [Atractiella rhizophila]